MQDFQHALGLFNSDGSFATHKCAEVVRQLDHVQDLASKRPQSEEAAVGFASFFELITELNNHQSLSTAELRIHRQVIMLGNWSVFKWLDMLLKEIWTHNLSEPLSWVQRLGQKVQLAVSGAIATGETIFQSSDYLPNLMCPPFHYIRRNDFHIDQRSRRVDGEVCLHHTVRIVHAIVLSWLGYASDTKSHARYYLCDAIIQASNRCTSVFLLEPAWLACLNVQTFWTSAGAHNIGSFVDRSQCQQLSSELAEKSVIFLDPSHLSKLTEALIAFREGARKYYRGQSKSNLLGLAKRTQHSQPELTHPNLSAFLDSAVASGQIHAMGDSPLSSVPSTRSSSPAVPLVLVAQRPLCREKMAEFREYYISLLPLLTASHTPATNRQQLVAQNMDYMLPFKMHQPALLRAQRSGGPYTPNNIRTRSGIFSMLVFRGCTFGAPAGNVGTLMFRDLEDWNAFRATAHLDSPHDEEHFYSNKRAYGTCITQRDPSIVPLLWNSSQLLLEQLEVQPPPTAETIWDYIRSSSQFPGMGDLLAFLIIGDLAHLGVLPMPSAVETGSFIRKLSRGAFGGLEILGLNCEAKDSLIEAAFVQLYEYMDEELSETQKKTSAWSPMVLENGLCKYKRIV